MTIHGRIALLFCFAVGGCATAPELPRYSGPGTQTDFTNARYQCLRETQNVSVGSGSVGQYGGSFSNASAPSCAALATCLETKGYMRDSNGAFSPSPGTAVGCIG